MIFFQSRTSFAHHGYLIFNREGYELFVVIVKATYRFDEHSHLTSDVEQVPILPVDYFWGQPGLSSIRYEADVAWRKPGVDLVVNGCAYASTPSEQVQVEIATRHFEKQILVTGDRVWESGVFGIRATSPQPFMSMPIVYERAFGGMDIREGGGIQGVELGNPIGTGFCSSGVPNDGTPLPNIEDPSSPLERWHQRPKPVGFGFLGRGWQPRLKYAGTYDAEWQNERFPLLPSDFNERHFLAAPEGQVLPAFTDPEPMLLHNLIPGGGSIRLEIPPLRVPVYARWERETQALTAELDTVIIEPDDARMILTCRIPLEVRRRSERLREVVVGNLTAGEERAILGRKRYIPLTSRRVDDVEKS